MSSQTRAEQIAKLQSEKFDVLVIGGGITGAGIALDAASRGLKVALIEKNDYASGTSSKSTKLIHGGLRYLKQFEIGLVREVGQERAIVHRLAPHLVLPEKMLLPFTEGGTFGYWSTTFALKVYDILAGVRGNDRRKMLSKKRAEQEEPLLRKDILEGAGLYAEYRTDDARLTIENIKTAAEYGAISLNYIEATALVYDADGKSTGAACKNMIDGQMFSLQAKQIVSAAGPWVDELRKEDNSLSGKHLYLSKGVHIVIPHEKLPVKHSIYIDVSDGRMIFIIPRLQVTYIGTTDTEYTGNKDKVSTNRADAQYLIDAVNAMIPSVELDIADIVSSWAGLRPLIFEEGKSASEISRKDEIFESPSGLLSIAGGKLTGYRKMAERIVNLVIDRMSNNGKKKYKPCHTHKILLAGGPFKNSKGVEKYLNQITSHIKEIGLPEYYGAYLVYNYGRQTDKILKNVKKNTLDSEIALAKAEITFCVQEEQVQHVVDFFNRRSGRLYFSIETIPKVSEAVLVEMQQLLQWDAGRLNSEREQLAAAMVEVTDFKR